jgi:hypothetical protein
VNVKLCSLALAVVVIPMAACSAPAPTNPAPAATSSVDPNPMVPLPDVVGMTWDEGNAAVKKAFSGRINIKIDNVRPGDNSCTKLPVGEWPIARTDPPAGTPLELMPPTTGFGTYDPAAKRWVRPVGLTVTFFVDRASMPPCESPSTPPGDTSNLPDVDVNIDIDKPRVCSRTKLC